MILDIVEKMVMLPIIITAVYMVIIFIVELNKGMSNIKFIKLFFCYFFSKIIIVFILAIIILNVYQLGTIWRECEVDNVLDPVVKSVSFIAIVFIWNVIGVVLIFNIWKHIYYTNNNIINKVKECIKILKERKSYGRYENTN